MNTELYYRHSILETLTQVYFGITSKALSENKLHLPMEKKDNLKLLLADDDEDDRELFTEVINEVAPLIKLSTVSNGEALMKYVKDPEIKLPDLIFLDLNMPCLNGRDCLREIKQTIQLKNIPVIIYSTSSHNKDIEGAFKLGADLYITKPNTFNDLKKIAKKVLSIDWANFVSASDIENFILR